MKNSPLFKVKMPDFVKAALLAGLAIIVSSLYQSLTANPPSLPTWSEFVVTLKFAGSTAGIYLLKNFLSNSSGQPFSKEPYSNFPNNAQV